MPVARHRPALLAVLIVVAYPETAHLALEDINPEDRPEGRPPSAGSEAGSPARSDTVDESRRSAPLRSWPLPSIHSWVTGPGDRRRSLGELVGRAERVLRAGDEQARQVERGAVLDAQVLGLARRVQRVADEDQARPPGSAVGARAIEHMRPPIERPPRTSGRRDAAADHQRGRPPRDRRRAASAARSGALRPPAVGEVDAGDRQRGDRRLDGDQRRVVPARPRAGRQQERRPAVTPTRAGSGGPRPGRDGAWLAAESWRRRGRGARREPCSRNGRDCDAAGAPPVPWAKPRTPRAHAHRVVEGLRRPRARSR